MIARIKELEMYEKVVWGICGSFTLMILVLVLLNVVAH